MIIIRYIILILYGIVLIRPILPVVDYMLRYEYYAEELCVMKDIPDNECCGKCQVTDAIAQQSDNPSSDASTRSSSGRFYSEEMFHDIIILFNREGVRSTESLPLQTFINHSGRLLRGYSRLPFAPPDRVL